MRIVIHDFSGYGAAQCEPIPAAGGVTRWYWEGGHFKKALGEIMLERISAEPSAASNKESVFGMKLEPHNWSENQMRIAAERASCLRDYPALFDDSANLVAALRNR